MSTNTIKTQVVVLGSGPGGYTAAFRAADLGKQVVLVERYDVLGGVCLNVGCIPSKALLHASKIIDEATHMKNHGISFDNVNIDPKKIVSWKNSIINKLTTGLKMLSKQRKVEVVQGFGKFNTPNELIVENDNNEKVIIEFEHAVIAVGSRPVKLPFIPDDERIFTSTGALNCKYTKGNMLVIGGGIIGLEMATVYASLGAKVTVVELADQIIMGADADIVTPLAKIMQKKCKNLYLSTKVTSVEAKTEGILITFENSQGESSQETFDSVLVAVGRVPNGKLIDADKAGVLVDQQGFINTNKQMQTNVPNIYAIGDVVGQPMLAHKAIPEGKIAAENIAGKQHHFEPKGIPSVAYTDPEIAWAGITENEAKEQGINYSKGIFPWMASGRSLTNGRDEGLTKVIFNKDTNVVIGVGIVGSNAGDLISEAMLAIEMGCDAEDISLTIHPHPTVSETIVGATEMYEGTITDLISPNK
ncbi:MAG: dihydrolipoyl dehydrogenase [Legionellales bacterium]|nr:dihydrolipoyl dehydrogenase [Legionellales bacterium]